MFPGMQGSHVLFLMNCHATPWQSFFHNSEVTFSFLDCSPLGVHPQVMAQNAASSTGLFAVAAQNSNENEQERFFRDPEGELCRIFDGCGENVAYNAPTHLVMYGDLLAKIPQFLAGHGYEVKARFSHNVMERTEVVIMAR
jgi:hypothetical protein